MSHLSHSPYLSGGFAPVRSEDDFALKVRGEIPRSLRGTLYRIGPNPQFQPRGDYHWFSGDGMIHAFAIEDGAVTYRNRYVQTPRWRLEREHGRSLFGSMNPLDCDPLARGHDYGVANTNIVSHGGELLALEEAHRPFRIEPRSLHSVGYAETYRSHVTAHPKTDPATGEMIWFAYAAGEAPLSPMMSYGVTDATGKVVRFERFEAPYCAMVHDFLVTGNHVLFPVSPLVGDLARAMKGGPPFAWDPGRPTYIGIMRRDAGVSSLKWFTGPASFVFHAMNAFETNGHIVADVCRYDAAPMFPDVAGNRGTQTSAKLTRWTFDLTSLADSYREDVLDDIDCEFPRIDERMLGESYRHGFGTADPAGTRSGKLNALAHLDLLTGQRQLFTPPEGDKCSEPVFIPRAEDAAEGDGWLTTVVWRAAEDRSDLLIFEALNLSAGPIATVEAPRRIPYGFHGNWVGEI